MKLFNDAADFGHTLPAAFGRLCVETYIVNINRYLYEPAAFGRLCVETKSSFCLLIPIVPAAFGRLCVETAAATIKAARKSTSRLRAAVC